MSENKILMTIYGREQSCASCVGAPGSKDTYEWLQAAIGRKYGPDHFIYEYVDMDKGGHSVKHQQVIKHMIEEDLFYPLILLNDEIIAEGIPQLKAIFQEIEAKGIPSLS